MKAYVALALLAVCTAASAQTGGLLRCEDGKGAVQYVEKFCPDGFKGVKDVRRPEAKTELEQELANLSPEDKTKRAGKRPLTEGQARQCVGRKNELAAMKKRLNAMETGAQYDKFAQRVQKTEEKYESDCKR
jgi:hypothetical protein